MRLQDQMALFQFVRRASCGFSLGALVNAPQFTTRMWTTVPAFCGMKQISVAELMSLGGPEGVGLLGQIRRDPLTAREAQSKVLERLVKCKIP